MTAWKANNVRILKSGFVTFCWDWLTFTVVRQTISFRSSWLAGSTSIHVNHQPINIFFLVKTGACPTDGLDTFTSARATTVAQPLYDRIDTEERVEQVSTSVAVLSKIHVFSVAYKVAKNPTHDLVEWCAEPPDLGFYTSWIRFMSELGLELLRITENIHVHLWIAAIKNLDTAVSRDQLEACTMQSVSPVPGSFPLFRGWVLCWTRSKPFATWTMNWPI